MNNTLHIASNAVRAYLQKLMHFLHSLFGKHECQGVLALAMIFLPSVAPAATTNDLDLSEMPLEQLLNMNVTILRGHDTLSKSPAAISVVTAGGIEAVAAKGCGVPLVALPSVNRSRPSKTLDGHLQNVGRFHAPLTGTVCSFCAIGAR